MLYELSHRTIYHWLVRVAKMSIIRLIIWKSNLPFNSTLSVYNGPGNLSPLLTRLVRNQNMTIINSCDNSDNNVHTDTILDNENTNHSQIISQPMDIMCTTFVCYIMVDDSRRTNITESDFANILSFDARESNKHEHSYIEATHSSQVIKLESSSNLQPTQQTIIKIFSADPNWHIFVKVTKYHIQSSNIWDCTFGGFSVLEKHIQFESVFLLCNRGDDAPFTESTYLKRLVFYSSKPYIYLMGPSFTPYSIYNVSVTISLSKCIGIFINPVAYPHIKKPMPPVILTNTTHSFKSKYGNKIDIVQDYSIHYPLNSCIVLQTYRSDNFNKVIVGDHHRYKISVRFSTSYNNHLYSNKFDWDPLYTTYLSLSEYKLIKDGQFRLTGSAAISKSISNYINSPIITQSTHTDCKVSCAKFHTLLPGKCNICINTYFVKSLNPHYPQLTLKQVYILPTGSITLMFMDNNCSDQASVTIDFRQHLLNNNLFSLVTIWQLKVCQFFTIYSDLLSRFRIRVVIDKPQEGLSILQRVKHEMTQTEVHDNRGIKTICRDDQCFPERIVSSDTTIVKRYEYLYRSTIDIPRYKESTVTWQEAESDCNRLGAHIWSIHSQDQLKQVLFDLIPEHRIVPALFIGIKFVNKVSYLFSNTPFNGEIL